VVAAPGKLVVVLLIMAVRAVTLEKELTPRIAAEFRIGTPKPRMLPPSVLRVTGPVPVSPVFCGAVSVPDNL
jgi:hypothetical protein